MEKAAEFSDCRTYRYVLSRIWDRSERSVTFIGLNPSTADETEDDPTIRRCIGFAKAWGYGGLIMANLFAYRATFPSDMKAAPDPIGSGNDSWLRHLADNSLVIAAWGNHGSYMNRAADVRRMLSELYCLKLNGSGEPAHPLYLKADLMPTPFTTDKEPDHLTSPPADQSHK